MDLNSSVNPSDSEPVRVGAEGNRVELYSDIDTAVFNREPPPPYSATTEQVPVTNEPISAPVIIQPQLKEKPTFYNCPQCEKRILTNVEYINSRKTHLFAGFICGFTFWCSLCCLGAIPYFVNSCKKAHHSCPNCEKFLGAYSRF